MNTPSNATSRLFRKQLAVGDLNRMHQNTACERLGIEITEIGPDFLRGRMPVDERTRQPFGILHGGAIMSLADTLGAVGAVMNLPEDGRPTIRAEGEVVRSVPYDRDSHLIPGVALRFRTISARDRRDIERFVGRSGEAGR